MKLISGCILIGITLMYSNAFSQNKTNEIGVTSVSKINILLPGFAYESKVGNHQTLNFDASLNFVAVSTFNSTKYFPGPSITVEYRNYYNLEKRADKHLPTERNSANYLAPLLFATYSKVYKNSDMKSMGVIGGVWGMQRNYQNRFSLNIYAGLGYGFISNYTIKHLQLISQLKLGVWLKSKKG